MNTLKLIAIALTLMAINTGLVYADHNQKVSDTNTEGGPLSDNAPAVSGSKDCCASCGEEVKPTRSEELNRRPSPVREWSFRDR